MSLVGIPVTTAQFFRGFHIHGDGALFKKAYRASAGLSGGEKLPVKGHGLVPQSPL